MKKLLEQNKIKDSQEIANNYIESLTSKEWKDGESDTKFSSVAKGVEQLSMLETKNTSGPQTLKWPHSRDGQDYSVPIESRKRNFKQLKPCELKKQQSLSPSSSLCHLPGPRRKSEAFISPKQPETIVCRNATCGSHFISESTREQFRGKSHFNNFHHSPETINDKASHHGLSKTNQDVMQSSLIKPRRLPPLKPTRHRPDTQLKILKNVPVDLSEASFISSSQEPEDTANDLFYPGQTKASQQVSFSCNNQCMSVGYEHEVEKAKVPKHQQKISKVHKTDLTKCIENPFDGPINQETMRSPNQSHIDVPIISQKEGCASKRTTYSHQLLKNKISLHQKEHLIPSNIYRNAPSDVHVDGLAEGLNKVHICNSNHMLAASGRRVAVCDSTDSAFRERMKTRALTKRFQLSTEGSLEAFFGNKNEQTPPRTTFGFTTRLRRVGICDKTDEALSGRMKLRTMKKRFGQTDEFGS